MTRALCCGVVAVLLSLWAYQSVWTAEWVYEDRAFQTSARTDHGGSRLVTYWTWRMAPTPRVAHVANLTLHLGIGGLVGLLAWRLGLTPFGAVNVACLWLLHALTVETTAYAKARSEQIVMLGCLVAMLAATWRWWHPLGAIGLLGGVLLAIGGEPSGVVVFLLAPLVIWHCRDRYWLERPLWAPWWYPALIAGVVICGGVLWYGGLRAVINADAELGIVDVNALTWREWLWAQSGAVAYWLTSSVWPALMTPDLDVDRLSVVTRTAGLLTLVAVTATGWWNRHTRPILTVACFWFVLALLPRLIVQTPRSYLNAAQFALSFLALALAAGYGLQQWKASLTHAQGA